MTLDPRLAAAMQRMESALDAEATRVRVAAEPPAFVLGADTARINGIIQRAQPQLLPLTWRIALLTWGGITAGFLVNALVMLAF